MSEYPAVKISALFILGILFQYFVSPDSIIYVIVLPVLLFIAVIVFIVNKNKIVIKNILLAIIIFLSGSFYYSTEDLHKIKYPFELEKIRNTKITGTVESIDIIRENKLSLILKLKSFYSNGLNENTGYKFLVNIRKDTLNTVDTIYNKLSVGNKILFTGTIKRAKNKRNPNEFDYEQYLLSKKISGVINCYKPETLVITNKSKFIARDFIYKIRKAIDKRIRLLHNPQTAALLKGLILADRSDIDYQTKKYFMNTGVIHVLAVSGLHVGFISVIFFILFARLGIKYQYILTIAGILLYLILTGNHPSVFRAAVMAVTFLIAQLTSRSTNGINSLSIAALIILLINPNELFNPGFLLSFSAVLSILIIYPILSYKINSLKVNSGLKKILLFIAVTFAAQIGTLPFTIMYFNKLSVVSLFANIFVIPIIGFVVAIGILTLIVSTFSIWLSSFFVIANTMLVDLLYYFVSKTGSLSFSFIPVYNFSFFDAVIFYFFITIILFALKRFRNTYALIIVIVLSLGSIQNYMALDNEKILPDSELTLMAIDVGQGDAFLIKFPDNKTALIDAGSRTEYFDNGSFVILPLLKSLSIDTLDYVFISHLDNDHFGGIVSLMDYGIIKRLYKPRRNNIHKDVVFEKYLNDKNIPLYYFAKEYLNIGGCRLYILNDTTDNIYRSFDSNNNSGIIKLVYGKTSFLFVGDLEKKGEHFLIKKYGKFLKADVLKIGHHGSNTSSGKEFIEVVNPEIGIISAGILNKFHHPSKKVLKRFERKNVILKRTDKEGAIILTSDGNKIETINWRKK